MTDSRDVVVAKRPYILGFRQSNTQFPLTSEEVYNLLDHWPTCEVKPNRLTLAGLREGNEPIIVPATLGGGDAFTV